MKKKQSLSSGKLKDEKLKAIKEIANKLFELLETPAEFKIEKDKDGVYRLDIKTEEGGILIGFHGETLQSLKHFLALSLFAKFGEWTAILVDVNGYWKKREEDIQEMAKKVAERVVVTGEPASLPFLTPAERRIVHLIFSSHPQVFSESEGEGRERRIIVKPRA